MLATMPITTRYDNTRTESTPIINYDESLTVIKLSSSVCMYIHTYLYEKATSVSYSKPNK
jgi:hypothetical protein